MSVMILSRWPKILMLGAALTLTQAAVRPAQAEIDLGTWETYATMAEQGAVCGAFADIMAMQVLVDEKLGQLWSERRNYSGSVIRRADGKNMFRIMTAGMSADEAKRLCSVLWDRMVGCMVKLVP